MASKIALIQTNIGGIDDVQPVPEQSCPYDYHLFTKPPYPLSDLSNRMKSKYIKFQHHKFLPGYDYYIYIDGRVEVTSEDFIQDMVTKLQTWDVVITKHPERKTVAEEYEFIFNWMDQPETKGGKYLSSRYSKSALEEESKVIDGRLPLYAAGVFGWKYSHSTSLMFNDWWEACIKYVSFDQCWFPKLAKQYSLSVYPYSYDLVKLNKHLC